MNEFGRIVAARLAELKADGVVWADVREITPLAECYVVAGAASDRQLNGFKEAVYEVAAQTGQKISHTEGRNGSKWIVVDCYDVVVHLFEKTERERTRFDALLERCPCQRLSTKTEVDDVAATKPAVDDRYGEGE